MIEAIADIFNSSFIIVDWILRVLGIISVLLALFGIYSGVVRILYRLGKGLYKRKIAIFSTSGSETLKNLLVDSKIFRKENILQVSQSELRRAEDASIFLVHWKDFKDHIEDILKLKTDKKALIVYAPQNEGFIDNQDLLKINAHRSVIIVNFRGRLLNDIVITLITTSYEQ